MRRGLRLALVATVVVAGAFLAAAGAFLAGVEASGEFLRAPLERALTAAFKVPTRIEGPIRLKTGLIAKISAEALVLADPSGPQGATLARGVRPGARIDLVALLRRTIALEEVSSERLELALVSHAEGRANWAPIFTSASGGGKASVSFAGIERLHIGSVSGSYQSEGGAPVRFAVTALDAALPLNEPMTARGSVQVFGQPAAFELQSASIASLAGSGAALPLQIRVEWSGLRASVDGSLARDGSGLDAQASASADDASVPLAALGIVANQAGRLEARMHVGISAKEALVRDLAVTLGGSVASGDASLAWDAPGWRVAADIAGKRIDVGLFLSGESPSRDESAASSLLGLLERAATGLDARLRLAIGELAGVPVAVRDLELDVRSSGRVFDVTSEAAVSGVRVKTTASYDARKAQRSLAMRIAGGKASTDQLPRDARPSGYAGSLAGIHGQLRGQGANARAILASLHGDLEARDLRWSFARHGGAPFSWKVRPRAPGRAKRAFFIRHGEREAGRRRLRRRGLGGRTGTAARRRGVAVDASRIVPGRTCQRQRACGAQAGARRCRPDLRC